MQRVERITESLSCILSKEELATLATELGNLQQQLDELKVTRKMLVSAIATKSKIAVDGCEDRNVEVVWESDFAARRKRLIRQDNFNEVRSVFMTEEDLKQELPFGNE